MKKGIHPKYNEELTVVCSCGNTFTTGSTLETDSMNIEICSKCHPFYTGQQKIVDSDNLIEKYEQRIAKSKGLSYKSKREKMEMRKKKSQEAQSKPTSTLSLRDMLENAKVSK